jgi:peroxiredoxin
MGYATGVGRKAPAFALADRDGDVISPASYRGDWFLVLVFLPGTGGGAPARLASLSQAAGQLWGLRAQLVAIREAGGEALDQAPAPGADGLPFPLLSDDGSVAQKYGVLWTPEHALPVAFVIDRAGKIVWTTEGEGALDPTAIKAALRDVAR